jgi:hypothetical protein
VPITGAEINTLCGLRLISNETQSGGGTDCIALFGNLDYQVRPSLLTQCSKLCSANMKTYTPRLVWLLRLRFGQARVAIRGGYAAKPALQPRHYSRQEPEVRVGHGLLDRGTIDTTNDRHTTCSSSRNINSTCKYLNLTLELLNMYRADTTSCSISLLYVFLLHAFFYIPSLTYFSLQTSSQSG